MTLRSSGTSTGQVFTRQNCDCFRMGDNSCPVKKRAQFRPGKFWSYNGRRSLVTLDSYRLLEGHRKTRSRVYFSFSCDISRSPARIAARLVCRQLPSQAGHGISVDASIGEQSAENDPFRHGLLASPQSFH